MAIEGKVARIIDDETIVINRGESHGVKVGMVFAVAVPVEAVVDPDTGEELGDWEAIKGRLSVTHVQERMAVCSPAVEPGGKLPYDPATHTLSSEMVLVSMSQRESQPLSIDKSQAAGMPKLAPIRVGDKVRSLE